METPFSTFQADALEVVVALADFPVVGLHRLAVVGAFRLLPLAFKAEDILVVM